MATRQQPRRAEAPCPAPLSRDPADRRSGAAGGRHRAGARRGRCGRRAGAADRRRRARAAQRPEGAGARGAGQGRGAAARRPCRTWSRAPAPTARISPASTTSAPRCASLKPERIAGCGGLATRHDAMLAAEAGADYVMFGEPDDERTPAVVRRRPRARRVVGRGVRDSLRRLSPRSRRDRAARGGRRRFRRGRRLRLRRSARPRRRDAGRRQRLLTCRRRWNDARFGIAC